MYFNSQTEGLVLNSLLGFGPGVECNTLALRGWAGVDAENTVLQQG